MKRLSINLFDSDNLAADNFTAPIHVTNVASDTIGVVTNPVVGNVTATAVETNPVENVIGMVGGNVTAIETETRTSTETDTLKLPETETLLTPQANDGSHPEKPSVGVVIAYVSCILIWGTTWFAVRQCVLPGTFEPFTACAWRFVIAAVAVVGIFASGLVKAPLPEKRALAWTVLCSVFSVISFAFVYSAERYVSGGLAAIIGTTTPLITALAATLTRTEKVTRGQVIGLLISMFGILMIFSDRLNVSAEQGGGVIFLILSVVLSSVSGVILKRHATDQHPLVSVSTYIVICAISFVTLSIVQEGGGIFQAPPMVPLLAAAYLGIVSSIISFLCYFYLLKRISLMALSKLVFFPPIIALVVDGFFETRVTLSVLAYVGIAITLIGVASKLPSFPKKQTN